MKRSLIALAALAASGCSMPSARRSWEEGASGHELRALNAGGLEASVKAQKATAPAFMPGDGRGSVITDKVVLGAGANGTPAAADTIDFLVPGGTRVADLQFFLDDCDTGTTFVFGVGYRAVNPASTLTPSSTYFAAAGQTIGQTGGRLECAFKPIKFEEDVYVQIVVGTAPAGISGNPEIHMTAIGAAEGIK